MSKEKQDILHEQFLTLPKVIQDTILDSKWQEKIRRVVKNNNLHIDQGAAIENLVLITMLGIETPETFVQRAQEYAQVTAEQAHNISAQVEREIFGDIRRKLIEATDGSGTVAEIDKATNELGKVAADIEAAAKKSTNSKPSLKDKIPPNYFEKSTPSNVAATTPTESKSPLQHTAPVLTPATIEIKPEIKSVEKPVVDAYREPIDLSKEIDLIKGEEEDIVITGSDDEVFSTIPEEIKMSPPPKPIDIDFAVEEKPVAKLPPKPIFVPMPKTIDSVAVTESNQSTVKVDPYREPIE